MKLFHEYLERQVKKRRNIVVMMNTTATREMIDELDPDAVIVAVGAEQIVPKIPGVEKAMLSFDVFGNDFYISAFVGDFHTGSIYHGHNLFLLHHFKIGNPLGELCFWRDIMAHVKNRPCCTENIGLAQHGRLFFMHKDKRRKMFTMKTMFSVFAGGAWAPLYFT